MTWQDLQRGEAFRNGERVDLGGEELWYNDTYVVHKRVHKSSNGELPPMIHLSIRRDDRQPCRDWRDFQRIKNQLAGPEWEAVEMYPAESRLVDMANQFHLWCFNFDMGIGYNEGRLVGTQMQANKFAPGAIQRDPEEVDLRYGGIASLEAMTAHYAVDDFMPKEDE